MRENRDAIEEAVRLVAQSWKSSPRRALEHYRAHAQRGAILGSVILTDCCWLDELTPNDPLRSNPWVGGDPCLWRVKDPELCEPWRTPGPTSPLDPALRHRTALTRRHLSDRVGAASRFEAETTQNKGAFLLGGKGLESWRARQDSNLWPSAPEADALSS